MPSDFQLSAYLHVFLLEMSLSLLLTDPGGVYNCAPNLSVLGTLELDSNSPEVWQSLVPVVGISIGSGGDREVMLRQRQWLRTLHYAASPPGTADTQGSSFWNSFCLHCRAGEAAQSNRFLCLEPTDRMGERKNLPPLGEGGERRGIESWWSYDLTTETLWCRQYLTIPEIKVSLEERDCFRLQAVVLQERLSPCLA